MAQIQVVNDALLGLQQELEKLRTAAELVGDAKDSALSSIEAADAVRKSAVSVIETVGGFAEKVEGLAKRIEGVDFPTRLDKLDATISGINAGVQNSMSRFDSVERNLSEKIKSETEGLRSKTAEKITSLEATLGNKVATETASLQLRLTEKMTAVETGLGTRIANETEAARSKLAEKLAENQVALGDRITSEAESMRAKLSEDLQSIEKKLKWVLGLAAASLVTSLVGVALHFFHH